MNVEDRQIVEISPIVRIGYTYRRGFSKVEYALLRIVNGSLRILSLAQNLGKKRPFFFEKAGIGQCSCRKMNVMPAKILL